MSPILDSIGNAKSYGWGSYIPPVASYESIASVLITGDSTQTITFDNIPQNFTHLQLRGIARNAVFAYRLDFIFMYINNDTTNQNYNYHILEGGVSTVGALSSSQSQAYIVAPADRYNPGAYSTFVLDIFDYKNTNKFKPMRLLNGWVSNSDSAGNNWFSSQVWESKTAITKIELSQANIVRYKDGSHIALYGIKGE